MSYSRAYIERFAEQVREYKKKFQVPAYKMADKAGVTRQTVYKILNNKHINLSKKVVGRLTSSLELDQHYILTGVRKEELAYYGNLSQLQHIYVKAFEDTVSEAQLTGYYHSVCCLLINHLHMHGIVVETILATIGKSSVIYYTYASTVVGASRIFMAGFPNGVCAYLVLREDDKDVDWKPEWKKIDMLLIRSFVYAIQKQVAPLKKILNNPGKSVQEQSLAHSLNN